MNFNFINNIKLRTTIILVAAIPLLVVLFFSLRTIDEKQTIVDDLFKLDDLVQLGTKMSNLVHEQQKERGATAGFLKSKGTKFKDKLKEQRLLTDAKRTIVLNNIQSLNTTIYSKIFQQNISALVTDLSKTTEIRKQVDAQSIAAGKAIGYYTGLNSQILSIISNMATISSDADITNHLLTYVNFLQSKERAGIERAVGAGAFSVAKFDAATLDKFKSLITIQDTYLAVFLSTATEQQKAHFKATFTGNAINEVERMRQVALTTPDDTSKIAATDWFTTITAKINVLKKIEDKLATDLAEEMTLVEHHAQDLVTATMILTIIALSVTIAFSAFMIIATQRRFTQLTTSMAELAEGNLETSIPEKTSNEIGKMATALEVFKQNALDKKASDEKQIERDKQAEIEKKQMMLNLAASFEEKVSSIVEKVAVAAQDLSHTATAMTNNINDVEGKANNVASSSTQTQANVQTVASAAEELSASVSEISQQLSNTTRVVNESVNNVTLADETALTLTEATNRIGSVVEMIKDIAEQINLLALNATIESARAGEAGKGFAVVASEVKNLAGQAATAVEEIAREVENVQSVSHNVSDVLRTVKDGVENINEYTNTVASAVEEQSATTQEIASNMQTASQGVISITHDIETVTSSTESAKGASNEVLGASDLLSQQVHSLSSEIQSFINSIRTNDDKKDAA